MCWKGPLLSKNEYQNLSYLNFQLRKIKDLRRIQVLQKGLQKPSK